jgi:DnaJ-class molecular chaperone
MKSYYEILEILDTATEDEIKKAFRKMAMKWHPDRNPGSQIAEEKFKEMKAAYEILIDPFKREQYDFARKPSSSSSSHSQSSNSNYNNNSNHEVFSLNVVLEFWEAVFGCNKTIDFYMPNDNTSTKNKLIVTLPPGIRDNETFVVNSGGFQFELNININVDDRFTRNNLDLFTNIEVPFSMAALGGKLIFPHWEGEFEITVPSGIKPQQSILIPNKGVKRDIFIGDLYLICNISVPKKLTPKQKIILEEFRKTELEQTNGIFDSIKNTWKNVFKH